MTNLSIQVIIKNIYGKETIYPSCETAEGFCKLLGQKTLTRDDIRNIKNLGYQVLVKQETPEL